jgi:hypothetical protein
MSYDAQTFEFKIALLVLAYANYSTRNAELTAIVTALNGDATKHDTTIELAPTGLRPGHHVNTRFTNDVLLVVNRAKGGNLTPAAMGDIIDGAMGQVVAPEVIDLPHATPASVTVGAVVSCTVGNWLYKPTSYAYQWLRGAATIAGATSANYTTVTADGTGGSISCRVTATNAAGSTPATSNAIAVAALDARRAQGHVDVVARGGGPSRR